MNMKGKEIHMVTFMLLALGGINWLLVGLIGWDVGMLFGGPGSVVSRIIYILIGLSAVYEIVTHMKTCKTCDKEHKGMPDKDMSQENTQGNTV